MRKIIASLLILLITISNVQAWSGVKKENIKFPKYFFTNKISGETCSVGAKTDAL